MKNKENLRKLVVNSSVVPQRPKGIGEGEDNGYAEITTVQLCIAAIVCLNKLCPYFLKKKTKSLRHSFSMYLCRPGYCQIVYKMLTFLIL